MLLAAVVVGHELRVAHLRKQGLDDRLAARRSVEDVPEQPNQPAVLEDVGDPLQFRTRRGQGVLPALAGDFQQRTVAHRRRGAHVAVLVAHRAVDELFDVALHDEQSPLQVGEGVAAAVHRFGHVDHAGQNAAGHHADGGEDGERDEHFQQGEGAP